MNITKTHNDFITNVNNMVKNMGEYQVFLRIIKDTCFTLGWEYEETAKIYISLKLDTNKSGKYNDMYTVLKMYSLTNRPKISDLQYYIQGELKKKISEIFLEMNSVVTKIKSIDELYNQIANIKTHWQVIRKRNNEIDQLKNRLNKIEEYFNKPLIIRMFSKNPLKKKGNCDE